MNQNSYPITQPKLQREQKDLIFLHIIRCPEIFDIAKSRFNDSHFDQASEPHYFLLWKTILKLTKKFGDKVLFDNLSQARMLVESEAKADFTAKPDEIIPEYWDNLFSPEIGLIPWLYSVTEDELVANHAKDLIKQWLMERDVQQPLRDLLTNAGNSVIINLPAMLSEIKERESVISELDDDPVESAAPKDWQPKSIGKFPTGIEFIDAFLCGGHAPNEIYGVLGAFGSGKTTLAIQLAVQTAFYFQSLVLETNDEEELKHSYYFHYECSSDEIRLKVWSHAAQIHGRVLEEYGQQDSEFGKELSHTGSLKKYEFERYADTIKLVGRDKVPGEFERLELAKTRLAKNVWTINMGGSENNPKRGTGYVAEIANIISREFRKGKKIGVVIIDYAGMCCRRHIFGNNLNIDKMRHLVAAFAEECGRLIARPFHCPVWVMHQLSGEANKRNYATKQHHADAAESKSFAENMYFCFELGTKHEEHGVMMFNCSKARRAQLGKPPLVKVNGPFSTIISVENEFTMDKAGQILSKKLAEQVAKTHTVDFNQIEQPEDNDLYGS